jgi:hypothetical protein
MEYYVMVTAFAIVVGSILLKQTDCKIVTKNLTLSLAVFIMKVASVVGVSIYTARWLFKFLR